MATPRSIMVSRPTINISRSNDDANTTSNLIMQNLLVYFNADESKFSVPDLFENRSDPTLLPVRAVVNQPAAFKILKVG